MDQRPHVDERTPEEIERDIAATRESISETVEAIEDRLHQAVDWRSYVHRHPWVAVIAAAGAGVLVGHLLAGRLHPARGPRPSSEL